MTITKGLKKNRLRKSWGKNILSGSFHSGPSVGTGLPVMPPEISLWMNLKLLNAEYQAERFRSSGCRLGPTSDLLCYLWQCTVPLNLFSYLLDKEIELDNLWVPLHC